MTITIKKSSCADTRTCDWSKVTKKQLLSNSRMHIRDVDEAISFFMEMLAIAAFNHDHTKISEIDHFFKDFSCGFKTQGWWENHRKVERHHLEMPDGVRDDVNLIDVLEHIADCVMAGKARSGEVRPLYLPGHILQRAFHNTARLLESQVVVED